MEKALALIFSEFSERALPHGNCTSVAHVNRTAPFRGKFWAPYVIRGYEKSEIIFMRMLKMLNHKSPSHQIIMQINFEVEGPPICWSWIPSRAGEGRLCLPLHFLTLQTTNCLALPFTSYLLLTAAPGGIRGNNNVC